MKGFILKYGSREIYFEGALLMGYLVDIVVSAATASVMEGLKRKPILAAHFLLALSISPLFYYVFRNFDAKAVLVIALAIILLSIIAYINTTAWLQGFVRDIIVNGLDSMFYDFEETIRSLIDKTIYDYIAGRGEEENVKSEKKILSINAIRIIVLYHLPYILIWIFLIISIDSIVSIISEVSIISDKPYPLLGYVAGDMYLSFAAFLASLIIAWLVEPWSYSGKEQSRSSPTDSRADIQYAVALLKRFMTFRGIDIKIYRNKTIKCSICNKILETFIETVIRLLIIPSLLKSHSELFITDYFQISYQEDPKNKNQIKSVLINTMIKTNGDSDSGEYILRPLKDKECKNIPNLGEKRWCWYKVLRKKINSYEPIGYAMLLIVAESPKLSEMQKECVEKIKQAIGKTHIAHCIYLLNKLRALQPKNTLLAILFGTEELLGFKFTLYKLIY